MLLEILFPLFCVKKQNVIQSYEFLPNVQRKLSPYFQEIQTNGNQKNKPLGNALLIYADKRE